MSFSAVTNSGFAVVYLQSLSGGTQFILMLLVILGGSILNGTFPLMLRIIYFQLKIRKLQNNSPEDDVMEHEVNVEERISFLRTQQYANLIIIFLSLFVLFIFPLIGSVMLIIYSGCSHAVHEIYREANTNFGWGSIFIAICSFHNTGFSTLNAGMGAFSQNWYYLTVIMLLVFCGESGYPLLLKLFIFLLKCATCGKIKAVNLVYNRGNEIYVFLFSTRHTYYCLCFVLFTIIPQFVVMLATDFNNENGELAGLTPFYKVYNSLYLAVNTRSGGFATVNYSLASSATVFVVTIMLYFPSYYAPADLNRYPHTPFVRHFMVFRNWIFTDLVGITIIIFLLTLVEYSSLQNDPGFSLYAIIFEVMSALQTTGYSLGYPGSGLQLVAEFNTCGKLVLMITMIMGKLRYIPRHHDRSWDLYNADLLKRKTRGSVNDDDYGDGGGVD